MNGEVPLYILRGKQPVRVREVGRWIEWLRSTNLSIAKDEIHATGMLVTVMTRFLPLDPRLGIAGDEPEMPLFFETVILGWRGVDIPRRRYGEYDAALGGHRDVVCRLRRQLEVSCP